MTRQELELKAKEFDSKLKRHPMSSEDLQKVLCDFVEALRQPPVMRSVCCNEELVRFKTYGYDECVGCGSTYRHTDA